jgi:hypothetical protein
MYQPPGKKEIFLTTISILAINSAVQGIKFIVSCDRARCPLATCKELLVKITIAMAATLIGGQTGYL